MRPSTPSHVTHDAVIPHARSPQSPGHRRDRTDPARTADSADPARTAAELGHSLVPRLADHVAIHLIDEIACPNGSRGQTPHLVLHRVAVVDGPTSAAYDVMRPGEILRLSPDCPVLNQLAQGETVHYPQIDSFTADHLTDQLGGARNVSPLRNRSVLLLPLVAGDTLLGNVLLIREPTRPPFGADEIMAAEDLFRWAARCIAADHRYRSEPRRWILPDARSDVAGLEVRHCCLPQGRLAPIGGDWCDIIAQPCGAVALVVGDVMGHGVQAAAVMNQCRTIVRTLVSLDLHPAEVLHRFDALTDRSCDDGYLATCICVTYDPRTRKCRIANAGHMPAILIQPNGDGDILDTPAGMPIGLGGVGAVFEEATFHAADGSVLALCSDGFVERLGGDVEAGLSDLYARLSGTPRPLDEVCDELLRGLDTEDRRDDVTLLVGRLLGTG